MITNDMIDVLIIIIGVIFSVIGIILAIACIIVLIREIILDLRGGKHFKVIVEKIEATEEYEDEEYEKDENENEENTEKNILQQSNQTDLWCSYNRGQTNL